MEKGTEKVLSLRKVFTLSCTQDIMLGIINHQEKQIKRIMLYLFKPARMATTF
jgi:hypothetical protein